MTRQRKKMTHIYIRKKKSQTFYISSIIVKISFISILKCFINQIQVALEEQNGFVPMPYHNLVKEPGIGEPFNNERESFQKSIENACWYKVNKLLNIAAKARITS